MNSRFVVSVSIATAVHALVLFGVKWPHAPAPVGRLHQAVTLEPFVLEKDPAEPIEAVTDIAPPAPKGTPDQYRPEQDEPAPTPSLFDQESMPRVLTRVNVVTRISSETPGILEGLPNGTPGIVIVSSDVLDNPPRTRSQISPNYPATERNAGITGDVMVEFIVDETGRVQRAHAVSSSHSAFELPAIRAVEKWRFEPGKRNGRPVRFRMAIPIRFSLDSQAL